jgi:hypothetical protein
MSVPRPPLAAALAALVLSAAWACAPAEPEPGSEAAVVGDGYIHVDTASGIMLDLPPNWRGRFDVATGITERAEGLRHQLSMRFVRADSSVATDAPLLVARVIDREVWQRIGNDSTRAILGDPAGGNETLALLVRPARENPFTPATADALGYDSLMIALFSRPLRAAIRPEGAPR